jgi:curved DNA-binding protein
MDFRDYYKDLGVEPTDPEATIKQAYRRLARKYHPDVSKEPDAEARFKAINEAWEALRDRDRRAAYDNLRATYRDGQQFRPPPDWQAGGHDGGADAGGFSDFFEGLFGQRSGRPGSAGPRPRRPRALHATIVLSLEQVFEGGPQRITLNGRTYDVRIPAGIGAGQTIRLAGQGPDGGDVMLEVAIAPHPQFQLEGRTVVGRLAVTPWQAALGAALPVATLGGQVQLTIPAGTSAGRSLRLKGRGLPGQPPGDHVVRIDVQVPMPRTPAQEQAYRDLAATFAVDAAAPG